MLRSSGLGDADWLIEEVHRGERKGSSEVQLRSRTPLTRSQCETEQANVQIRNRYEQVCYLCKQTAN